MVLGYGASMTYKNAWYWTLINKSKKYNRSHKIETSSLDTPAVLYKCRGIRFSLFVFKFMLKHISNWS